MKTTRRALLDAASDNATVGDDAVYEAPAIGKSVDDAAVPAESPAAAPHPQDDINVVAEIPEHKDEAARAVAVEFECGPSHRNRERRSCHRSGHVRSCCDARRAGAAASRVIAIQRRKSDRRRSEASSASERSARRALWAERRRADRVVQLKRFGNLEQKFHDRVVVISRRAFRHILLVKDSCSARDSVNGTEVAFH